MIWRVQPAKRQLKELQISHSKIAKFRTKLTSWTWVLDKTYSRSSDQFYMILSCFHQYARQLYRTLTFHAAYGDHLLNAISKIMTWFRNFQHITERTSHAKNNTYVFRWRLSQHPVYSASLEPIYEWLFFNLDKKRLSEVKNKCFQFKFQSDDKFNARHNIVCRPRIEPPETPSHDLTRQKNLVACWLFENEMEMQVCRNQNLCAVEGYACAHPT